MIFLKGRECTEDILSISQDTRSNLYLIRFKTNPDIDYRYRPSDVMLYYPKVLDPHHYSILYKDRPFSGLTGIYRYEQAGYWYLVKDSKHWLFRDDELKTSHSILEFKESSDVLAYLKELSFLNPLRDDDGIQILSKRYSAIDFVPDSSVLGLYLCGAGADTDSSGISPRVVIFPFGCNKSQKKAVMNALPGKLSVVQGPPGTGKTQTILTIIANLLYQGKSAEIVSNNNSAVDNIREKLEKHGLAFVLATLGSSENKKQFIGSQLGQYPDLDGWHMELWERRSCEKRITGLSKELDEYFSGKRKTFDLPLKLNGTEFQKKIWQELIKIPYGKTISYKELARKAGNEKACRAAGMANNKNKIMIVIPCHRVIGSNGKLTGYAGGLKIKAALLRIEHS